MRGLVPPLGDVALASKAVVDAVAGLGPLQPLLDDPEIEEIWIGPLANCNRASRAPSRLFLPTGGGGSPLPTTPSG